MTQLMDATELQIYFDAGALKAATVVPVPMGTGFFLQVDHKGGEHTTMAGTRKVEGRQVPRQFKTLDAAAAAAHKVGFRSFKVEL